MSNYPCVGCIVAGICKSACEKIGLNTRDILDERCCPDCGDENAFGYSSFSVNYIICKTCGALFYYSTHFKDMRRRSNRNGFALKGITTYNNEIKTTFGEYIDKYIKGL